MTASASRCTGGKAHRHSHLPAPPALTPPGRRSRSQRCLRRSALLVPLTAPLRSRHRVIAAGVLAREAQAGQRGTVAVRELIRWPVRRPSHRWKRGPSGHARRGLPDRSAMRSDRDGRLCASTRRPVQGRRRIHGLLGSIADPTGSPRGLPSKIAAAVHLTHAKACDQVRRIDAPLPAGGGLRQRSTRTVSPRGMSVSCLRARPARLTLSSGAWGFPKSSG